VYFNCTKTISCHISSQLASQSFHILGCHMSEVDKASQKITNQTRNGFPICSLTGFTDGKEVRGCW
jgi:hypothetical protein